MANTRNFRTNLNCAGTATLAVLSVSGAASFPGGITGGISVTGNSTFNNNVHVIGDMQVDGSINFSGGQVFADDTFQVQDNVDATKFFSVDLGGATTGFSTQFVFAQTADRIINVPDADTTIVGTDAVQALTNKTIDATMNTISALADTNISAGAAITRSKLASGTAYRILSNDGAGVMIDSNAITAARALISDANGIPTYSTTTDTEISYVGGVTSAIQTQLDSKQATGNYITALTSDVTAAGPGSVVATVVSVGTSSAANVHSAELAANAATDANTASTIVKRDGSGNFSAGTISANLTGNASGTAANVTGIVTPLHGGTGQDFSGSTGLIHVAAGTMSVSLLVNADVDAAAAIARSKLASGTANHVVINDGTGVMSSEASLLETRGGTHQSTYTTGDTLYASASNTLSKLAIGTPGQMLKVSSSNIPSYEDWISTSAEIKLYDDWIGDGTSTLRWLNASSGTGGAESTSLTSSDSNHPGIVEPSTGTLTTSSGCGYLGGVTAGTATAGFTLGGGQLMFQWLVQVPTLSDGTNTFSCTWGLSDTVSASTALVIFQYLQTSNVNFLAVTRSASTSTSTDTGIVVTAGSWYKLKAIVNAAGTNVDFYINDVLVCSNTTNIPTSTPIAPRFNIVKSAGVTARSMYIDYFKLYQRFTVLR